jgi:hypothetical protein
MQSLCSLDDFTAKDQFYADSLYLNAMTEGQPKPLNTVKFLHLRAPSFRSFNADGVWGSIDGYGRLHFAFFNEYTPMPKSLNVPVTVDGNFLNEQAQEEPSTDANVIREIQFDLVANLNTAKLIHTIIGNFIKMREEMDKSKQSK